MYESIKQFYKSYEWQQCRKSYIKLKRGLCERCLAKGIVQAGEQVHHKIRLSLSNINNPKVTLDFKNLELLCTRCHEDEHRGGVSERFSRKRYRVNADGSVEIVETPPSKKES